MLCVFLNKSLLKRFSLLFCLLAQCSCRTQVQWKSCSICVIQILLLHTYAVSLTEQAERYEEMVEFMEKVSAVVESKELTIKERNLLSIAYKNKIGARRASWRIISSIEQKEESHGNEDHVSMIQDYRSKIESQLSNIYDGILKLLDTRLIPSAATGDSKVLYLKIKGK